MFRERGRCPYCYASMVPTMHVSWHGKYLSFPYPIYLCYRHGYFVWRGEGKGHILADFSKLKHEAIEVRDESPNALGDVYAESPIVKMKCKYCGYEWKQYLTPWVTYDKGVWCPNCDSFLDLNKDNPIVERYVSKDKK
jgi:hypothetical protein